MHWHRRGRTLGSTSRTSCRGSAMTSVGNEEIRSFTSSREHTSFQLLRFTMWKWGDKGEGRHHSLVSDYECWEMFEIWWSQESIIWKDVKLTAWKTSIFPWYCNSVWWTNPWQRGHTKGDCWKIYEFTVFHRQQFFVVEFRGDWWTLFDLIFIFGKSCSTPLDWILTQLGL